MKCWPWSHLWTKWKSVSVGNIERTGDRAGEVVGFSRIQERECETCGKVQVRTVRAFGV
jgi:hypothetical protein